DTWTFSATAGDNISIALGEVEPTINFSPWIRLISPSSAVLGSTIGELAVRIGNVTAPQSGTYTVLVAANPNVPSGTGNYVLTLAKAPGGLTISPGDQGGALTNGANHNGEITLGDIDAWTFSATAGDSITISLGEVEP